MKILIVGGDGMLGHQLLRQWVPRHEVKATVRKDRGAYASMPLLAVDRLFHNVDVRSPDAIENCIAAFRPDAIVNAAGIVKQREEAQDRLLSLEVNSLFPHRLALIAKSLGARVVHFGTDCVFSGRTGNYAEEDFADADDLYGRTKLLGELDYPHCITLRTSIIGRELFHKEGLLEWFLAQQGTVRGFTRAIYTGFTTIELGRIVERLLSQFPDASGVWQVSSDAITKYELLCLFRKHFNKKTEIVPDDSFKCDRSLDSRKFRSRFNYTPPAWAAMVGEISRDKVYI
jgi:dTDP-4-dehydrorhamnose reductase